MLHFTGTGNPLRIKCDPVTLMSHDQGADKQEQYASFSIKKLWLRSSVFIEVDHMHPRHKSKIMIRVRKSQQDEVLVTASSAEQTHKWHLTVGYVQYSCIYILQPLSLPGKHPLLSNITRRRMMFEAHFFSLCFKGFALN